jgi:ABC-type glycerol-3-phosphate transport system substrate-binding protein/DNA-binding transcriptional regulator YhcF (GntR family)
VEINPDLPIPIYQQLRTMLIDDILERRYAAGERLPTEKQLCELHGLSRTPVHRALSELAAEGVIVRHRRRGSFVNPEWLSRVRSDTRLRAMVPAYGPWEQLVREAADGADVQVVRAPRDVLHRMLTRTVAEGNAPDIAVFDNVWTPEFAGAGFLHPFEDLDPRWVRREHDVDFLGSLAAADRFEGRTFGVPAFAEAAGLWFDKRRFQDHKLEAPTTWNELLSCARALRSAQPGHPLAFPGGVAGGETTAYCLTGFLASNGATIIDGDHVNIGSAESAQTLRFLRRLVTEECLSPAAVGYSWDHSINLLASGEAAMSIGGTYEAEALVEQTGVGPRAIWDQFGFVPIPAGPRAQPASVVGAMVFAVFRQSTQPKAAMRLIERAVAPLALAAAARRSGRVPSRRSALTIVADELPFLANNKDLLEHAVTRPWIPLYSRVSSQLQSMLEVVLTGQVGPAQAAQRAAELIGAIADLPTVAARRDAVSR